MLDIKYFSSNLEIDVRFYEDTLYINSSGLVSTDQYKYNLTDTSQSGYYNLTRVWANTTTGFQNSTYPYKTLLVNQTTDTCTCVDDSIWAVDYADYCWLHTDCSPSKVTGTGIGELILNATLTTNFTIFQDKPTTGKIVIYTSQNGKLKLYP